jgi:hypothetical protein
VPWQRLAVKASRTAPATKAERRDKEVTVARRVQSSAMLGATAAFHLRCEILRFRPSIAARGKAMRPKLIFVAALAASLIYAEHAALAGNIVLGPGPGLTGNDTGGIIMYAPGLGRGAYHQMAANWCARWGRLSHLTSMHRHYGDYVGFVCIDRPWMIH